MERKAFILRIAPSRIDKISEALKEDQIIIGWAKVKELLDTNLTWERFREIIRDKYCPKETNWRRAGRAAGHMWRFIREMNKGDLVVVPHGREFYVAEIEGEATHDDKKVSDDTAFRRRVKWLNNKKPIPRNLAKSALISRMKTQGTSADATDLLAEINECLTIAKSGQPPTFHTDL